MILADKITALRKKAGWSQEELAEQLGVTRQSVSKWEGAQSVPDMDKVVQMSRLFGVTTDFLLKDELSEEEDYTRENKAKSPVIGAVSGIYWLLVTPAYLLYPLRPLMPIPAWGDTNTRMRVKCFFFPKRLFIFAPPLDKRC